MSEHELGEIERAERLPRLEELVWLALSLRVSIEYLGHGRDRRELGLQDIKYYSIVLGIPRYKIQQLLVRYHNGKNGHS